MLKKRQPISIIPEKKSNTAADNLKNFFFIRFSPLLTCQNVFEITTPLACLRVLLYK
jgi:hypothetical protein